MRMIIAGLVLLGLGACETVTGPNELDRARSSEEVDVIDPTANEPEDRAPQNEFLTTDRESYVPGSTAIVTLENVTGERLGHNLCLTVLEQGFNTGWQRARFQHTEICTSELEILEPGETASWPFELDARLEPGLYRFRSTIEQIRTGERMDVVSNRFEIVR